MSEELIAKLRERGDPLSLEAADELETLSQKARIAYAPANLRVGGGSFQIPPGSTVRFEVMGSGWGGNMGCGGPGSPPNPPDTPAP